LFSKKETTSPMDVPTRPMTALFILQQTRPIVSPLTVQQTKAFLEHQSSLLEKDQMPPDPKKVIRLRVEDAGFVDMNDLNHFSLDGDSDLGESSTESSEDGGCSSDHDDIDEEIFLMDEYADLHMSPRQGRRLKVRAWRSRQSKSPPKELQSLSLSPASVAGFDFSPKLKPRAPRLSRRATTVLNAQPEALSAGTGGLSTRLQPSRSPVDMPRRQPRPSAGAAILGSSLLAERLPVEVCTLALECLSGADLCRLDLAGGQLARTGFVVRTARAICRVHRVRAPFLSLVIR